MKINKLKLLILAVASLSLAANAQGTLDYFAQPRTVVVSVPQQLSGSAAVTNNWVDIHTLGGIAKLDVSMFNISGSNAVTFAVQTSADQTNLVTLANVAIASALSVIYTNATYGGTSLTATNTFNIAGTLTTPTSATAGWATQYIIPAPFTNSGTGLTLTSNSITTFGFKADDAARYVRIVWTGAATVTNVVSVTLTAQ